MIGCVQSTVYNVGQLDLLTLQPHTGWLQIVTARQTAPGKAVKNVTVQFVVTVDTAEVAALVPPSAAVSRRTVSRWWLVVVSVECGELHSVLVAEWVLAGVTRVPGYLQPVVVRLWMDYERTVLGKVPVAGVATWLQVKPQLIAAGQRQLTEQVVAKPVVASRVVETGFKLRPRTVEDIRRVRVLLDQQRNAVVYRISAIECLSLFCNLACPREGLLQPLQYR